MHDHPPSDPYRSRARADTDDARAESEVEVEVAWPVHGLPRTCACCDRKARASCLERWREDSGSRREVTLLVPYCARCLKHLNTGRVRRWKRIGLAALVGLTFPWLVVAVWDYAPMVLVIAAGLIASLLAFIALERLYPVAPIDDDHGCTTSEREALQIEGFNFEKAILWLRGTNPAWVERAAPGATRKVTRPRPTGLPRAVGIGVAALCGALALFTWALSHGEVYLDNPSSEVLRFDVDSGRRSLTLAPGAHGALELPSGERDIVVKAGSREVDHVRGRVGHWSLHALTPLGLACYAFTGVAYGEAKVNGPDIVRVPRERRWHDLGGSSYRTEIFAPLPREVRVRGEDQGVVIGRFGTVPCEGEE